MFVCAPVRALAYLECRQLVNYVVTPMCTWLHARVCTIHCSHSPPSPTAHRPPPRTPHQARLSAELRNASDTDRFIYTTHPWLVSLYLDCPVGQDLGLHCPSVQDKLTFEKAVRDGDIVWQAFPFNAQVCM